MTSDGGGRYVGIGLPRPHPALGRLDFLAGVWTVEGVVEGGPLGPAGSMWGVETFEWLEGGFFLVHHWNGAIDVDGLVMVDTGYEFLDYDPTRGEYRARWFSNSGPYDEADNVYRGNFDDGVLVLTGPAQRRFTPRDDDTIAAAADLALGEDLLVPFLRTTLTRSY